MADQDVLLKVENLCQYFKVNKAVDDVSFDIKKGEVFGLVGESGCGKTTTGRSIIKLYDITSGSIYYKGRRIAAGTKSYRDEIKAKKAEIAQLKKNGGSAQQIDACQMRIQELNKEIVKAKKDHKEAKPQKEQKEQKDPKPAPEAEGEQQAKKHRRRPNHRRHKPKTGGDTQQ